MKYIFTLLSILSVSLLSAQCIEETHSAYPEQGWVSCQTSLAPVPERGNVHWLQYDLGHVYPLENLKVWNHNVWGEIERGVQEINLDFSLDGSNWNSFGPITVEQAPGSWKYTGGSEISLGDIPARYVLISVASTYGDESCAGIAEMRFGLGEMVAVDDEEILNESLSVFPNPASDYIFINSADITAEDQVVILDATGRQVQAPQALDGQTSRIEISGLPAGLYYAQVFGPEKQMSKLFVVTR
ncbi:MAG: T9SS type A sorting domain-containing protein [Bacteroidota bacterium]